MFYFILFLQLFNVKKCDTTRRRSKIDIVIFMTTFRPYF